MSFGFSTSVKVPIGVSSEVKHAIVDNVGHTEKRCTCASVGNPQRKGEVTIFSLCILYNQRDATYTMFFIIIISVLHVSGDFSDHHQQLIKLYVQLWILSCFPAIYRWCGWVGTVDSGR
jgi:hypothetical protein